MKVNMQQEWDDAIDRALARIAATLKTERAMREYLDDKATRCARCAKENPPDFWLISGDHPRRYCSWQCAATSREAGK